MTIADHTPFECLETAAMPPAWWTSRVEQINTFLDERINGDRLVEVGRTSGGRAVRAGIWGDGEPELMGKANFNSAVGAHDLNAYVRRDQRDRPVLFVLAGAHGHEVEGMVAAMSLMAIMQTGQDITGADQPELHALGRRLRVIVIPCTNPDGRRRVPYDGLVGLTATEMSRVGQGTFADGELCRYPRCKATHPMTGNVGSLGGYFDDAGVNLMHDEWFAPFSPLTSPLLAMVGREAPDLLLNMHSHGMPPAILALSYVPMFIKQAVYDFADRYGRACAERGLTTKPPVPIEPDGPVGSFPPTFNLTSAMYHAGAALPMTFESPHGLVDADVPFDYEQILEAQHVLFLTAMRTLLEPQ